MIRGILKNYQQNSRRRCRAAWESINWIHLDMLDTWIQNNSFVAKWILIDTNVVFTCIE